jgi:hypothetical protein
MEPVPRASKKIIAPVPRPRKMQIDNGTGFNNSI